MLKDSEKIKDIKEINPQLHSFSIHYNDDDERSFWHYEDESWVQWRLKWVGQPEISLHPIDFLPLKCT